MKWLNGCELGSWIYLKTEHCDVRPNKWRIE